MNIEELLSQNLRPVSAPPQLWARVLLPGEHHRSHGRRLAWCLTAALIFLMAVWGFRARGAGSQPALARAPHSPAVQLAYRGPRAFDASTTCLRCHLN
jgi:hypothetical protein